MTSVFQHWLDAEFAVAEAEARFRVELQAYQSGRTPYPPLVLRLIRARVLRHEARSFLERAAQTLRVL